MSDLGIERQVALIYEIDACASLLRRGLEIMEHHRTEGDIEPMLACLAPGVEKTLKLAIGLRVLADSGAWPPLKVFKGFGHGIVELNARVVAILAEHAAESTAPNAVREQLERVEGDAIIAALLLTLDRHGRAGRFYNLDQLSAATPRAAAADDDLAPPRELWEEVFTVVYDLEEDLLEVLADDWEQAMARLTTAVSRSLRDWIGLIDIAWNTGVLGSFAASMPLHRPADG